MDLVVRGVLLDDQSASDVVIRRGRIAAISAAGATRPHIGSRAARIIPPLFDIQVNGIRGIDLQDAGLEPRHVLEMTEILAAHGVGRWVPTLITGPVERMERACRVIAKAMEDPRIARAVPGIHLEGPHISPLDGPRGAHPKQYVRPPDAGIFDRLYRAAQGRILYVTLAPELAGAGSYIRHVVKCGVAAALGHHGAGLEDIARAVDAGATLCTHLGNGLASSIHRHHNPLWPQLAEERLAASLIPDLHHLPAPMLKTFVRAKGVEKSVLVSDCVHIAGLQPGRYELAGHAVDLLPSGRICLEDTDLLAGSSLMLLQGVLNAVAAAGISLEAAVASATAVPARILGLKGVARRPVIGKKAHFVVFDGEKRAGRSRARIQAVFMNGERQELRVREVEPCESR